MLDKQKAPFLQGMSTQEQGFGAARRQDQAMCIDANACAPVEDCDLQEHVPYIGALETNAAKSSFCPESSRERDSCTSYH